MPLAGSQQNRALIGRIGTSAVGGRAIVLVSSTQNHVPGLPVGDDVREHPDVAAQVRVRLRSLQHELVQVLPVLADLLPIDERQSDVTLHGLVERLVEVLGR